MSQQPDGTFACDRCGAGVGNGGIDRAVVVSDIDKENRGMVLNLHFCRDRVEGDEEIRGCEHRILSPSNIKTFTEKRAAAKKDA